MNEELLILYGTETGNSELLAMDAQRLGKEAGFDSSIFPMDEIDASKMQEHKHCLLICSTWGDGEQPDNAQDLYDEVSELDPAAFSGIKYAVLALGDTAFDLFCEAGIQWDDVMESKGAYRLHERIDCDTDYDDYCEEWIEEFFQKM
jgi:sulfite reductase (NADPH) flavoprotein alpha-component